MSATFDYLKSLLHMAYHGAGDDVDANLRVGSAYEKVKAALEKPATVPLARAVVVGRPNIDELAIRLRRDGYLPQRLVEDMIAYIRRIEDE